MASLCRSPARDGSRTLAAHDDHKFLTAEAKGRSLGDPWIIAHALAAGATIVTKEELTSNYKPTKIKIPNVMTMPWMK